MTIQTDLLAAIETYFDAIYHCDTDKLNAVFHPQSSLFDADNGTVFVEPIESFSRDVAGRVSPASQGQAREAEVLLIDFLSPISATVKIRIRAHQRRSPWFCVGFRWLANRFQDMASGKHH